jgi:protein-S-isoprenylcysteine O-methyltransferase Ste14
MARGARTTRWSNIPIPESYAVSLAAGIVAHLLMPLRFPIALWIGHAIGWPITIAGVCLAGWSVTAARQVRLEDPETLVTTGPYRFSRNPMYLAWAGILLGIAFLMNSIWPAVFMPAAFFYTHVREIPKEEQRLAKRFGETYRVYKTKVPRYLSLKRLVSHRRQGPDGGAAP